MKKKDLLDKWLNGELTPEEFEVFSTIPEFSSFIKIDSFVREVELPRHDVESGLEDLAVRKSHLTTRQKPKLIKLATVLKIAAVLTLLAATYLFVSNYEIGTNTEFTQTELYQLPDNSRVFLNENSKIELKGFNWKNNRLVDFHGEGFFEVQKGSSFTVQTARGSVTVLGTKFNLVSNQFGLEVSCYEGLVRVDQGDISIELPAGRSITLEGGNLDLDDLHTLEPGWIHNESRFDDRPILQVISVLEDEYGLTASTENIDVNLRFTGGFPNDDLEAALQAITVPFELNYTIENKDAITIFSTKDSE